ncbi:MAG: hypothetical protein ACI4SF_15240 [Oscillospiraceae bacterium]
MTNEEMLLKLLDGQAEIMKTLDDIKNEAKITRNAVNYSSDKLEELITLLNETNVIREPLIKAQRSFRRFEKCTSLSL